VFDFALKIVEVDGEPKQVFNTPGHKNVWRSACHDVVSLWDSQISEGKKMLEPVLDHGVPVKEESLLRK